MQTVESAFTAEAKDQTRYPAHFLQVAWKKNYKPTIRIFTIGVSTIGGTDLIGGGTAPTAWSRYQFWNESDYMTDLSYERNLQLPLGGIAQTLADATLDNTSGRFLPQYMGGNSELFTSILPRRPMLISTGFEYNGVDNTIPQFVGTLNRQPQVDRRGGTVQLSGIDMMDFLVRAPIDTTSMFTGLRTDQVIERILVNFGYTTADYQLDTGLNNIGFGLLESGTKYGEFINKLVQAEAGHFYMDEQGVLRFENRQHWDNSPHNAVTQVIYTADVIEAMAPDEDTIYNTVEIRSNVRAKQDDQQVWSLGAPILLTPSVETEYFISFDDPMLQINTPVFLAFDNEDGSGTERTSSVSMVKIDRFAQAMKIVFKNNHSSNVYVTTLNISGRPAKVISELYHRAQDDSSVTAFEERPLTIENDFIQSTDWAQSLASLMLQNYGEPQNMQRITIRARPHLQMGDMISWQGRYWRIMGIKTRFGLGTGFIQELNLLTASTQTYFRIGISTIGGPDLIAA